MRVRKTQRVLITTRSPDGTVVSSVVKRVRVAPYLDRFPLTREEKQVVQFMLDRAYRKV